MAKLRDSVTAESQWVDVLLSAVREVPYTLPTHSPNPITESTRSRQEAAIVGVVTHSSLNSVAARVHWKLPAVHQRLRHGDRSYLVSYQAQEPRLQRSVRQVRQGQVRHRARQRPEPAVVPRHSHPTTTSLHSPSARTLSRSRSRSSCAIDRSSCARVPDSRSSLCVALGPTQGHGTGPCRPRVDRGGAQVPAPSNGADQQEQGASRCSSSYSRSLQSFLDQGCRSH